MMTFLLFLATAYVAVGMATATWVRIKGVPKLDHAHYQFDIHGCRGMAEECPMRLHGTRRLAVGEWLFNIMLWPFVGLYVLVYWTIYVLRAVLGFHI